MVTKLGVRAPRAGDIGQDVIEFCAAHAFFPALPEEFGAVEELAGRLMRHKVTSAGTFRAIQAVQPYSSFCFRENGEITGLLGILLLRQPAVDQLMNGSFDGEEVDTDLLSRPSETPAIGYGWGLVATTKPSSVALNACTWPLRAGPLGALTFVTTAVTPVGRHFCITRLGYRPMRHADDNLLLSDPIRARQAA